MRKGLFMPVMITAVFFLCLGYGWRWHQDTVNIQEAFLNGKKAGKQEFISNLFAEAEEGRTFVMQGLRAVPRLDNRLTIERIDRGIDVLNRYEAGLKRLDDILTNVQAYESFTIAGAGADTIIK